MDHHPTNWGRPLYDGYDAFNTYPIHQRPHNDPYGGYGHGGPKQDTFAEGVQRTQQPIVTGTSVLAIKYKDGIMMAGDNLASYGSLARFKDIQRLHPVGKTTVIAASGDMSDFQYIQALLDDLIIEEEITAEDKHALGPKEIHEYLSQVMYRRRSKMNPLWNSLIVGGYKNGERFLSYVDLLGTTFSSSTIATGYGAYIAQPLLRKEVEGKEDILTEEQARKILETSLKVLFFRDARSLNKYQIATINAEGAKITDSLSLKLESDEWAFAEKIRGYGPQTQ